MRLCMCVLNGVKILIGMGVEVPPLFGPTLNAANCESLSSDVNPSNVRLGGCCVTDSNSSTVKGGGASYWNVFFSVMFGILRNGYI